MEQIWIDRLARQVAATTTRRGLARLGLGGALAGLALDADEVLAACRAPKQKCSKGNQCCSGKCKKGKCAKCGTGTTSCSGGCVDPQTSVDHCGGCGNACVTGQTCAAGQCTCDGTACAGCCEGTTCRAGTSDGFCGAAGGTCQTCPYDKTCLNGSCVDRTCPGGHCRAFVTSTTYDGNLGGLAGADAACQDRAQAVSLPGTYMAWLSDSTNSPLTRFPTKSPEPYRLVNDTQIAANWARLTDGKLDAALSLTESGSAPGNPVDCFTNTWADGTAGGIGEDGHCQNWTRASGIGNVGRSIETNILWSSSGSGADYCANSQRLYCFQQS